MRERPSLQGGTDDLLGRFLSSWEQLFLDWFRPGGWELPAEISMEGDKLIFKVALPGIDPRGVEILIVGNQLVIKGERQATQGREDRNFFPKEMRSGQFERTLPLPEGVSADSVNARYHDGVLEISMPAPRGMTPRRIPIEVK